MTDNTKKKVTLGAIKDQLPTLQSKKKDNTDLLELSEVEVVKLRMQLDNHKQAIKDRKADRKLRKRYADKIIYFLQVYSIVVGGFIFLAGFKLFSFGLPDQVLIALVSSTAIAAIGLVGFIAKGLFDTNKD